MAQIPYQPFNDRSPSDAGTPFQRVQASPDAFGGQQAQALQRGGADIERGATAVFDAAMARQHLTNEVSAAETDTLLAKKVTDRWSNYGRLEGRAALDALPAFKTDIEQDYKESLNNAPNEDMKARLAKSGRFLTDSFYRYATNHADSQWRKWAADTSARRASELGNQAVLGADYPEQRDTFLAGSNDEVRKLYEGRGYDLESINAEVSKNLGHNVSNIVKQLTSDGSQTGLQRAIEFYHTQYDKIDAGSRVTIENSLRVQSANYDGRNTADKFMGRAQNVPPGYIQRTFQIESGGDASATTGSYKGLGQFGPASEAKYGINDSNRSDPAVQARALTLENQDNHDALAKALGHEPTPADYYLAHQQGLGGAVAHLSNPTLPAWKSMVSTLEGREKGDGWARQAIWGNMTPEMKAQFPGGVDTVSSADFTRMWAQRFNNQTIQASGVGPDGTTISKFEGAQQFVNQNKSDVLAKIQNDPYLIDHPQAMQAAISHVDKIYETQNASYADQERKLRIEREQTKAVSDSTENNYLKDIYSPVPKASVQAIVNDDRLTHEAKTRLIHIAGDPGQKDEKTYGAGFEQAFRNIHAPPGDPDRITDPNQLYSRLGRGGDLTMAGVEKLRAEIEQRKTPEGAAEAEMRKQFLSNAKAQISGSNEGLHIKDPKGDELYLKFMAQALPLYDAGRKQGKTAAQLLDPNSPDYVGKVIPTFKRPMNQWFADIIQDGATAQPQGFDAKSIKTIGDAVEAYRSGKITKAQADQLAIANGWATRKSPAAASNTPVVPMSQ